MSDAVYLGVKERIVCYERKLDSWVRNTVNSPHSLREASLNTYLQFRSTKHLKTTREGLSVENMF